jgi:hypothetical protein
VAVVGDAEPHAIGAPRGDHPVAGGEVERHRLLAQHVLARFGGCDGLIGVQVNRRRDVDGVDSRVADALAPVGVRLGYGDQLEEGRRMRRPRLV